ESAKAAIQSALDAYGLGSLATFAWNEYLAGKPVEQIMLDIRATPDYQARFPAMATLAKQGRAITESQYVDYERNAYSLAQAVGEANLTGYGALNRSQAETLAAQGLTAGQLGAGFAKLGTEAQVFNPLPGNTGERTITVDQQLAAQFENNVAAQQAITTQEQERLAEFKAGGTVARAHTGAFGAGVAQ